jgi:hypothetical protein
MAAAAPALDCWGALEEPALTGVVSTALGRPATLAGFEAAPVDYEPGSPATGALLRLSGTTADGEPWRLFLKVLHHPRHWSRIGLVPEEVRQLFFDRFPWRGSWWPGSGDSPTGCRPACGCPACTAWPSWATTAWPYRWRTCACWRAG